MAILDEDIVSAAFVAAERNREPTASASMAPAPTALTSVLFCMSVLAVCAVAYFAIRCYYEEKRLRRFDVACKCGVRTLAPLSDAAVTPITGVDRAECGAVFPHAAVLSYAHQVAVNDFYFPSSICDEFLRNIAETDVNYLIESSDGYL